MTDYLRLKLPEGEIKSISSLGLAHIGDAVYELMVRSWLCSHGGVTSGGLHRSAVKYVSAPAQAQAAAKIMESMCEDELKVYRRGRNTKVRSVPQNADISEYHAATGLEALFGWLYLHGNTERINELFEIIMENK